MVYDTVMLLLFLFFCTHWVLARPVWSFFKVNVAPELKRTRLCSPPLLDLLNVLNANGAAAAGAEGPRLLPGWALAWNDQWLAAGAKEKRFKDTAWGGSKPKCFLNTFNALWEMCSSCEMLCCVNCSKCSILKICLSDSHLPPTHPSIRPSLHSPTSPTEVCRFCLNYPGSTRTWRSVLTFLSAQRLNCAQNKKLRRAEEYKIKQLPSMKIKF